MSLCSGAAIFWLTRAPRLIKLAPVAILGRLPRPFLMEHLMVFAVVDKEPIDAIRLSSRLPRGPSDR
jgi:hypothetical protein